MKYSAFFSFLLLASSVAISKQESNLSECNLDARQEQDELLSLRDLPDQETIDVQLPRNEATQELIKAMQELWDTVKYEPDITVKSLFDEQASCYSSLAMERALEVSFDLLEEHGEKIPEKIHMTFTRSLSKLVSLSEDFDSDFDGDFALDGDDIRCSCAPENFGE